MLMKLSNAWRLFAVLVIASFAVSACRLSRVTTQQEKATGLWGELVGQETLGQSFVSAHDNLYRLDLGTATYGRTNTAEVIFHLRTSPQATTDIATVTLAGPEIQNDRPTSITFSPILNSQGRSYYFYLESPRATPGNAITVYWNENEQYTAGTAYRNGQPVHGDLAFTAYNQETYDLKSVWASVVQRLSHDPPFFICYGALLLVVSGLLLVLLWRASDSDEKPTI